MVLPTTGSLSLSQIQTEFGGFNPIGINEYYRGGFYVPSSQITIPTSGTISISNFYGTPIEYWPCVGLYDQFDEKQTDVANWTSDNYGQYFTPTAGSFTFYFDLVTDLNVSSMTAYLYRGTTLLTSRTTDGTFTTTLQASQHRFRLVTVFSNVPNATQREVNLYVRQTNSSGCLIQRIRQSYENLV